MSTETRPRDPSDNKRAAEVARAISNFLNGGKQDIPDLAALLLRDHRTLQQLTMRLCMTFIQGMAKNDHDLRNEASVKLAQKIVAATDDCFLPYI